MLKAAKLTNGIGARIAHNILCTSTVDALMLLDHVLASVANAKTRKTTKTALCKAHATSRNKAPVTIRDSQHFYIIFSRYLTGIRRWLIVPNAGNH
jgi:hypothetical protein